MSVIMFQFPRAFGLSSLSPFCTKLEAYLRLANIPHTTKVGLVPKAPKGKLPYIEHNGQRLGDSSAIITYLKETFGDTLDHELTSQQRAMGHLVQRTVEESLYFSLLYMRWLDLQGWKHLVPTVRRLFPGGLGILVAPLVRRGVCSVLKKQGMGRHSTAEVVAFGTLDMECLSCILGHDSFLFGRNAPSSFDVILYAFMEHIFKMPHADNALSRAARAMHNLVGHRDRVQTLLNESAGVAETA